MTRTVLVHSSAVPLLLYRQVIWVDLLTEKEFSAGFGSHTPMYTGQVGRLHFDYHAVA